MVHGVADGAGQGFGKLLEFFTVGCIAGDEPFLHAVGAHQPPFVVVSAQPELGDVLVGAVFVNFPGFQVTVVVHNGHMFRNLMVEFARCVR